MNIQTHIGDIIKLIEEAGETLIQIYHKEDLDIELKADSTPVTEADRISNDILTTGLQALFPDIPVLSEESGMPLFAIRSKWERVWIIDPLDGTKEFIYKNGRFCINIALIKEHIPVFGMIYNICEKEIVWAFRDDICYLKKEGKIQPLPIETSDNSAKLKMAVSRFNMTEAEFTYIDYLQTKGYVLELIPLGASSKHCAIAKGSADICVKFGRCYEWDTAAGQVIIEAAGGRVINAETLLPLEYNKKEMVNPPFLIFSKKLKEEIEAGNDIFTK